MPPMQLEMILERPCAHGQCAHTHRAGASPPSAGCDGRDVREWSLISRSICMTSSLVDGTSKVDVGATTFCARCLILDTDAHHARRREAPSPGQARARACAVQVQVKTTPRGLLSRVLRICAAGHGEQWCPDWHQTNAELDPWRRALRSTRRRTMPSLGGSWNAVLSANAVGNSDTLLLTAAPQGMYNGRRHSRT
jgi:hypothetical protein